MTKRLILYFEDRDTFDGRRLEETRWPQGKIPLMLKMRLGDWPRLIGHVRNLERVEVDGYTAVTAEASIDLMLYTGLAAEADFKGGETTAPRDDLLVSRGAKLTAVVLGERPCWPGMRIGD